MKTTQLTPQPLKIPAGSRGGAGKVIVIILGVIFVLVVAVVIGIWAVWHHYTKDIHVSQDSSGQASINIPGVNISANQNKSYTADELGIDIYPGATPAKGNFSMNTGKGSMVTATFVTNDSAEAVSTFYKGKAGPGEKTTMDTDDGSLITYSNPNKESVTVTVKGHDSSHDNKTSIIIIHTKESNP